VFTARSIRWHHNNVAAHEIDGSIVLAFVAADPSGSDFSSFVLLERDAIGAWRVRTIPRFQPIYLSLTGEQRTLNLLYIEDGGAQRGSQNAVFSMRSSDKGDTWTSPARIDGKEDAAHLVSAFGTGDRINVAWLSSKGNYEVIRRASSQDEGHTWQVHADMELEGMVNNMTVLQDRCGQLHAFVESGAVFPTVTAVVADDGGWRRATSPADGHVAVHPIGGMSGDRMGLFWTALVLDSVEGTWSDRLFISTELQ